jgi:chromosome condensin MukBEF ATPase and DNA-binding subunit MukB
MSVAVGTPSNYRVCEYCDIKSENPQLEEYYRLECQLRQSDQEVVVEKIKWLKKTSKELERQIAQQREDISLLQASSKRQIEEVQAKIDSLNADKQRLEKLKETLLRSIEETAQEVK